MEPEEEDEAKGTFGNSHIGILGIKTKFKMWVCLVKPMVCLEFLPIESF